LRKFENEVEYRQHDERKEKRKTGYNEERKK
jgi:hypothetical protein